MEQTALRKREAREHKTEERLKRVTKWERGNKMAHIVRQSPWKQEKHGSLLYTPKHTNVAIPTCVSLQSLMVMMMCRKVCVCVWGERFRCSSETRLKHTHCHQTPIQQKTHMAVCFRVAGCRHTKHNTHIHTCTQDQSPVPLWNTEAWSAGEESPWWQLLMKHEQQLQTFQTDLRLNWSISILSYNLAFIQWHWKTIDFFTENH